MTESNSLPHEEQEPKQFWEERYAQSLARTRGKAGQFLRELTSDMLPKRALELGCSTGDDTLWLAEQGWQVSAVDISEQAIQTAQRLANESGLAEKIHFQTCDLSTDFPAGTFELVCALYFQSPYTSFPRIQILQTAASRIVPGGHLLIVTHASGAPWSNHAKHHLPFPTLEGDWKDLALPEAQWQLEKFSVETRLAKGPQGQEAEVKDNLILARRN
jgi:SAM-dependent methyltransferase